MKGYAPPHRGSRRGATTPMRSPSAAGRPQRHLLVLLWPCFFMMRSCASAYVDTAWAARRVPPRARLSSPTPPWLCPPLSLPPRRPPRWTRPPRGPTSGLAAVATALPIAFTAKSALPITYMVLLALQFAVQPVLTQKFAPKTIIRSTYVLAQDCVRLVITAALLTATQSWTTASQSWALRTSVATAGLPALLYLIQSYCSLAAYQNLAPITYNVLNQTKTLSAAVCCFLLLGQRQSLVQGIALGVLLLAALVMESIVKVPHLAPPAQSDRSVPPETAIATSSASAVASEKNANYFMSGVLPILLASLISGLAGAWTQRSLRGSGGGNNNSLLFTLQLSIFSIILLGTTLLAPGFSPDRERARVEGWSVGWTAGTWIPIVVNAVGGVLVGLVTKFSGVVPKGFALIAGMFLSGILQNVLSTDKKVTAQQWVGGVLAAVSVWMHSAYPYAPRP